MFDGGLVKEAMKYPRGKGLVAVRAVWTGISVSSGTKQKQVVHHLSKDLFVGTWKLIGIETHSKVPREIVAIMEPGESANAIEPGDILIIGRGAVSKYSAISIEPKIESPHAVEVGRNRLRGILFPSFMLGNELLVFHDPAEDISVQDIASIDFGHVTFNANLNYIGTTIARYTLEFKLSGKAVSARSIIDVLSPIRSFVLDASEEMCLDIPRKKGRRGEEESELFEPVVTSKAASVRFRVHPSSSNRTSDLDTSSPLKLLSLVLRMANSGDGNAVRMALEGSLKSIDESLKQIEAIVKTARKQNLEFSATDAPRPIALGNRALSTIQSIETTQKRTKKVQGDIYAVDLHRRWCRVSTSNTDPQEDWKLEFSNDLKEKVRGKYPRRVEIEFETETRVGVTSGRGLLLSIEDFA